MHHLPVARRWWSWNAEQYAREAREERAWSETSVANAIRCLRAWPDRFGAAGLRRPVHAGDVTAAMVLDWKRNPMGPGHYSRKAGPLRQPTAFQALWCLRGFLEWAGNPVAAQKPICKAVRGDATNRRWFDKATVDKLWESARSDRERLVVALTAWQGLRRVEISWLLVGDCSLAMDAAKIVVTRKGGRRQELPISRAVANALRPFVLGRSSPDPVFPATYNVIDRDLRRLGVRIGIGKVSCHDLRRTFGRLLYYGAYGAKVDINRIRILYGHRDTAQTLYYIGAASDDLRAAIETFDTRPEQVRQPVPVGA